LLIVVAAPIATVPLPEELAIRLTSPVPALSTKVVSPPAPMLMSPPNVVMAAGVALTGVFTASVVPPLD
jgi:hypothetical protein